MWQKLGAMPNVLSFNFSLMQDIGLRDSTELFELYYISQVLPYLQNKRHVLPFINHLTNSMKIVLPLPCVLLIKHLSDTP